MLAAPSVPFIPAFLRIQHPGFGFLIGIFFQTPSICWKLSIHIVQNLLDPLACSKYAALVGRQRSLPATSDEHELKFPPHRQSAGCLNPPLSILAFLRTEFSGGIGVNKSIRAELRLGRSCCCGLSQRHVAPSTFTSTTEKNPTT